MPRRRIWHVAPPRPSGRPRSAVLRSLAGLATLAVLIVPHSSQAIESWQIDVGYDRLLEALGDDAPDGAGIGVSQVEAAQIPQGESLDYTKHPYMPTPETVEWASGEISFLDVNNLPDAVSGGSPLYSGHATGTVGARIYGNTEGLAKEVTTVEMYEANDWLSNVLRYASTTNPDMADYSVETQTGNRRVENHSWIGTLATQIGGGGPNPWWDHVNNVKALRRYDYLVDHANLGEGLTAVVGVNNNTNPLPYLLSQGYNSIAVGVSNGNHSSGLTGTSDGTPDNLYGAGRSKPDLVAPGGSTSAATAMVSSAAVLLHDTLSDTPGRNAETVKSILLAGANKEPAFNWAPDISTTLGGARSITRPLDDTWGAGELDVWNNHLIASGGQHAGSTTQPAAAAPRNGWDYRDLKSQPGAGSIYYTLEIPTGTTAQELSIALSWHVEVTDTDSRPAFFSGMESLQDLNLRLYDTTAGFVLNSSTLVAESISTVDNVEHLYFDNTDGDASNDIASGVYTLAVDGAGGWDYGLAWRMSTLFDQPSADFNNNGIVDSGDYLIWQRSQGVFQGADHGDGDADGDGDVDDADLTIWQSTYGTSPLGPSSAPLTAAVPEPAAWLLAASAAGISLAVRRRRGRQAT